MDDVSTCDREPKTDLGSETKELDESRTSFSLEDGLVLREFFDLLHRINEREHVC